MVCLGNKLRAFCCFCILLRLHPSIAFQTLLLTMMATPFSSKGFLPTVVEIMVIWVKFTNARGNPKSQSPLEMKNEFPTTTQEEAWLPCCNLKETRSFPLELERNPEFLLQLEKRPSSPAETRKETWGPHLNFRGGLTILFQLKRYVQNCFTTREEHHVPTSTLDEPWFPCSDMRWIMRSPLQL